jgi:hypothetical protein
LAGAANKGIAVLGQELQANNLRRKSGKKSSATEK